MQPLRRPSIFGSAGTAPSTLDLFWPTNTSSASGHRASGWGGKGQPHQELDVGLGGAPWPRIDLQLPGTAAVLMIRAALEAADVGLIQASGGVIRGAAADVRGRAEPLSRRGHRRSCGAAGHRPPPRARPGASSRSAPHTGIGRPPTNRFVAAKSGNAVFAAMGLLRLTGRGQSIWVGSGRPSKSPELMAMRAAHLAATRAARVAKKTAVPAMGSVLCCVPPQSGIKCNAALQQNQSR